MSFSHVLHYPDDLVKLFIDRGVFFCLIAGKVALCGSPSFFERTKRHDRW